MVKPSVPPHALDVLIVSPTGGVGDLAHRLHESLVALGLHVKLDVVSLPRILPLPEICETDARRARFCVVLGEVGRGVLYAMLAPYVPGQRPDIAPIGTKAAPGQAEIGTFDGDVPALAARVRERLRLLA
jgi:hypothetical protein